MHLALESRVSASAWCESPAGHSNEVAASSTVGMRASAVECHSREWGQPLVVEGLPKGPQQSAIVHVVKISQHL